MPSLLRELHALIPSYGNLFFWADDRGELSNLYGEIPETAEVAPLYVQEFYNRRDYLTNDNFPQIIRNDRSALTREQTLPVDMRSWHRSDVYNMIYRPMGAHDYLRMVIREGNKPLGLLVLLRGSKDPPFTAKDARLLESLEEFIAHALTARSDLNVPMVESGSNGLIIVDSDGRPQCFSPEARRLLFLATHPEIKPGSGAGEATTLPPALLRICQNLIGVYADAPARAPVYRHTNVWGGFTFRAYRLEGAETSPCMVGITVSHQEPLPLRLMRQMEDLPLTRRQAQVCLLMASGLSYAAIAQRLDISRNTAIAHSRWIYNTLNVSSRTELLQRLLPS